MMRCLVLILTVFGMLAGTARADEPVDAAREALEKAKTLYTETAERAKFDLEAAGAREVKKLRAGNKKNVTDQLARIEKIEAELRQFSEHGTLPKDVALSDDVDKYRETLSKARQKCEKAFDILAQKYVAANDDSNAKRTLEEKVNYFRKGFVPGIFEITTNPPFGHATLEMTPDGKFKQTQDEKSISSGTWQQTGKAEILLTYTSAGYGTVNLKIIDDDHLTGPNLHPNGYRWEWRVIRKSAATFVPGDFECTTVPDEGRWTFSLKNDGTCTNTSPDGSYVCRENWQQVKNEILFEIASQGNYDGIYSKGILTIKDKDHLSGTNHQLTDNRKWEWTVVRKKSDPAQK